MCLYVKTMHISEVLFQWQTSSSPLWSAGLITALTRSWTCRPLSRTIYMQRKRKKFPGPIRTVCGRRQQCWKLSCQNNHAVALEQESAAIEQSIQPYSAVQYTTLNLLSRKVLWIYCLYWNVLEHVIVIQLVKKPYATEHETIPQKSVIRNNTVFLWPFCDSERKAFTSSHSSARCCWMLHNVNRWNVEK